MSDHPFGVLLAAEAARSESDLNGFRTRALTVVTTSAGVVTLLTGIVTFAASKTEEDKGIPDVSIVFVSIALAAFVLAAICALKANSPRDVERPAGDDLEACTAPDQWHRDDAHNSDEELQRLTAEITAKYVVSLRDVADSAAKWLRAATWCQIAGLVLTSVATIVTLSYL